MIFTEFDSPNPNYKIKQWVFQEACKAQIIEDKVGNRDKHEVWDGLRWYSVPKEVFDLFLRLGGVYSCT